MMLYQMKQASSRRTSRAGSHSHEESDIIELKKNQVECGYQRWNNEDKGDGQ